MPAWLEYLLYLATATLPEIAVVVVSLITVILCVDSFRVGRQDCAIIARNGGDSFAFRECHARIRAAIGRGIIATIFLFLGIVAARTSAVVPLIPAALVSFILLATVVAILGYLQILDRRDRNENIRDLLALRRARESNAAGIIAIDRHSIILQFNAAAERIFGYSADEAVGLSMTALIPERFRDDHLRGIARAYNSDTPGPRMHQVLDLPGLRKDGTEVGLHITLSETTGAAGKAFVAIFTEEIPGVEKIAKGVDELRHDAHMEAIHENTAITAEAARSSDAAQGEAKELREYLTMRDDRRDDRDDARDEREHGRDEREHDRDERGHARSRDERDREREDRADARSEREQDRQDTRDDRRDERERNRT